MSGFIFNWMGNLEKRWQEVAPKQPFTFNMSLPFFEKLPILTKCSEFLLQKLLQRHDQFPTK